MSSETTADHNAVIDFFYEGVDFNLENPDIIFRWLLDAYKQEKKELRLLNYIFCSDAYLHKINVEYLNHDTFTDIITFSNARKGAPIEGDIFISIDRVKENALTFDVSFEKELLRVLIHGSLHLMGYNDKSSSEQKIMSSKEDFYINHFSK